MLPEVGAAAVAAEEGAEAGAAELEESAVAEGAAAAAGASAGFAAFGYGVRACEKQSAPNLTWYSHRVDPQFGLLRKFRFSLTFETMTTRKSFSFILQDSTVCASVKIFPLCISFCCSTA